MASSNNQSCKYFASEEGCRFGAMCKFSHDQASGAVGGVVRTQPEQEDAGSRYRERHQCRYFRKGYCKDGSRCRFLHNKESADSQEDTDPKDKQTQEVKKSRHICKYFISSSGCRLGQKCRYRHEVEEANGESSNSESEENQESAGKSHNADLSREKEEEDLEETEENELPVGERKKKGKRNYPCKYFNSSAGCRLGDNCRYLHKAKETNMKQSSTETHSEEEDETTEVEGNELETLDEPGENDLPTGERRRKGKSNYPCKYFNSPTGCRLGENCRYLHKTKERSKNPSSTETHSEEDVETGETEEKELPVKETQRKGKNNHPCKYFNFSSGCHLGENCRFLHEKGEASAGATAKETKSKPMKRKGKTYKKSSSGKGYLVNHIADMTEDQQKYFLDSEIGVLKGRYPKRKEITREKGGTTYQINFVPSDPDWPYDVKSLNINIYFPPLYPKKMMEAIVLEQENLPETVRRCIGFSIADWTSARFKNLEQQGKVERVFRPFVKWLDGDLEDIFTDALTHYQKELVAKAAGIEFIPARHLQAKYQEKEEDDGTEDDESSYDGTEEESDEEDESYDYDEYEDMLPQAQNRSKSNDAESTDTRFDAAPKGTEIKIKDLQLGEYVATLVAASIKLSVRCGRCKETGEVNTPPERLNQLTCSKCSQSELIKYRSAMTHGFSAVLGHLELEECTPSDLLLLDCDFVANCLRCNRDNKLGGIPPGQPNNTWCRSCHAKLVISLEGVQFRKLQPAIIEKQETVHKVTGGKSIRNVRDPAIKEGRPLPDSGTCKHFKKSFRWLRFPCCGKTYPCDICHDEKEDHEMKYANRMVCGFCAHEQPYSGTKPCSACDSSMTSRTTTHWEGGKGCRDVVRMSRNDGKKYTNSNKTSSRKSQAKTQGNKKTKPKDT